MVTLKEKMQHSIKGHSLHGGANEANVNGQVEPDKPAGKGASSVMAADSQDNLPAADSQDNFPAADNQDNLPIDRGWAWVIMIAAWVNVLFALGLYKVSGIVFVEIQKKFGSSSSVTSLVSSLLNVSYSITSMLMNTVFLAYISVRQSVMIGGVLLFLTFVVSALATSIELIVIVQGFVLGLAMGLVLAPTYSLVGQYFDKRRGVANCFVLTGGSVGSLMFSFVIRLLVNEYGLSGAFLLIAGFTLHLTISGALMRPIESYKRTRKRHQVPEQEPLTFNTNADGVRIEMTKFSFSSRFQNQLTHSDSYLSNSKQDSLLVSDSQTTIHTRKRTVSEAVKPSVFGSISSMKLAPSLGKFASNELTVSTSIIDLSGKSRHEITGPKQHGLGQIEQEADSPTCACVSAVFGKLRTVVDCKLMTRGSFLFFLLQACFCCGAASLIQIFIPPYAKDVGLSDKKSYMLITVISLVEMISVLMWGFIADRNWIRKSNIIGISCITFGMVTYLIPFCDSFELLVIFSVVYGISGRLYFPLYPVVLAESFGLENLRSAIGLTILFQCSFIAVTVPLSGLLRDVTGSYERSFQIMATFLAVGGIGIVCLPLVEKCERKWRQKSNNRDITVMVTHIEK